MSLIVELISKRVIFWTLSTIMLCHASLLMAGGRLTYCVRTNRNDFYPFQTMENCDILDYYRLLLKSYVSDDPQTRILEKMSILPQQKKLVATVSTSAKWQDGTQVSARDVAYSIAKGLTNTFTGKRIWIQGTESINKPGWKDRQYSGICIIDNLRFELTFEAPKVSNPDLVLGEALTAETAYNRLWPARLDKVGEDAYKSGEWDAVTIYPVKKDSKTGRFVILFDPYEIEINGSPNCDGTFYRSILAKLPNEKDFVSSPGHNPFTLMALPNKNRLPHVADRLMLAQFLRAAFAANEKEKKQFFVVDGHFVGKEQGRARVDWPKDEPKALTPRLSKEIHLALWVDSSPPIMKPIEDLARKYGVKIVWYPGATAKDFYANKDFIDARIVVDIIRNNRQYWIHDMDAFEIERFFMNQYDHTRAVLQASTANSVVSNHVEAEPLVRLERAFRKDVSIAPIARYFIDLFTKKGSPVIMRYDSLEDIRLFKNPYAEASEWKKKKVRAVR